MKRTLLLAAFAATLVGVQSCRNDEMATGAEEQVQSNLKVDEQPDDDNLACSYVDGNWSPNAYLNSYIMNNTQTNFIYNQHSRIAALWRVAAVPLSIVHDNVSPNSTYNAISYYSRKIYFGEAIYRDALNYGQIVPAMILAHEWGHQLQYYYGLPKVKERTARAGELEADGFAGYYMRRPNGYNASWAQAGPGFNFAFAIGDYNVNGSDHHGTPSQRRSATRLGWYLGEYNLTAREFDDNFFYYYNQVLNSAYRGYQRQTPIDPTIDRRILSHMDELRKISTGEISAEEFERLGN
ncbi:MAG: metalloprotease [Chryseobacterium sp.]|nr:MAG: metalloprotease [Chryseobacterium sp.]